LIRIRATIVVPKGRKRIEQELSSPQRGDAHKRDVVKLDVMRGEQSRCLYIFTAVTYERVIIMGLPQRVSSRFKCSIIVSEVQRIKME